jgi:hypothetical protein
MNNLSKPSACYLLAFFSERFPSKLVQTQIQARMEMTSNELTHFQCSLRTGGPITGAAREISVAALCGIFER